MPTPVTAFEPGRRRLWQAVVAVAVVSAAAAAAGIGVRATYGAQTTADEPQYLLTAISLAEDRDLDIADERIEGAHLPFHEAPLPVQTIRQADGSRVSPHDPLLPALLAGPVALGGWVGAKVALSLLAGVVAGATVWVAVRRAGVPLRAAAVVGGAVGASAPMAVYGTQVYPELPAAGCVLAAVGALVGPASRRSLVVAVLAVVALPWLAVKYVPVAAVLGVAVVIRSARSGRRDPLFAIGALVAAGAAYLVAHQLWYGGWTVYAAGDHFVDGELTAAGHHVDLLGRSRRLVGLLVDRDFGLAAWQPLWLLGVPALAWWGAARGKAGRVLVPAVVGAGWLTATFVALTMHGFWWPGRQVVVVLPVLAVAIAGWVGSHRWRLALAGALGAAGVVAHGWIVVEGLAGSLTWVVDFERTTNPFVGVWRGALVDYRAITAGGWVLHGAWSVAAVVAAGLAVWLGSPNTSSTAGHMHHVNAAAVTPSPRRMAKERA